jgi:chaperonin GroES
MRVLNDNVLVEVPLERKQTASGLYIPETAQEGQVIYGTVIKVGNGRLLDNGQRTTVSVTEGDTVYFPKFNATKIDMDGKTLYVMSEQQIVLVK